MANLISFRMNGKNKFKITLKDTIIQNLTLLIFVAKLKMIELNKITNTYAIIYKHTLKFSDLSKTTNN